MPGKPRAAARAAAGLSCCLLLLIGALAATFESVWSALPGEISGRYDIYRYYGPITFYLDYCLAHSEWPLWNPLVYCGLPNGANPQAFVFYPWNVLRSVSLGTISPQATAESLIVFAGIHLLLMGAFTFLLARAHKLSFAGALTAALVWICSALIVRRAAEYHFFYTLAWLPLILLLLKHAMDARRASIKAALVLAAGLVFGTSILGGFLQIVNYMGVTIGIYVLFYRILFVEEPVLGPRRLPTRRFAGECALFLLFFAVAVCAAAVLLLPTTELAAFSARQKGAAVPMYSDLMKWTITRLYQSAVVFTGMSYEVETLRGAGVTAFLLAAAGLFHSSKRHIVLFGLMGYALVDCGFGPPFPIALLVNVLTPFTSSAYSRGFDFAMLPLGLLAGLGVDSFLRPGMSAKAKTVRAALLVYVAAAALVPLYGWVFPKFFLPIGMAVIYLPLAALALMLLLTVLPMHRRWGAVALLALPALFFAETWAWNRHYVPWMIKDYKGGPAPLRDDLGFPETNRRFTDPIANRALYGLRPVMNGVDPLHFAAVRDIISGTPRDKQSHRLVTDWEPTAENSRGNLMLKRYFWLAKQACLTPLPGKFEVFPSATTVFLDSPPSPAIPLVEREQLEPSAVSPDAVRIEIPAARDLMQGPGIGNTLNHSLNVDVPAEWDGVLAGSAGSLHSTLVCTVITERDIQFDTRFTDAADGRTEWGLRHRLRGSPAEQTFHVPIPDMRRTQARISVKAPARGRFEFKDIFLLVDPGDEDGRIRIDHFSANEARLTISDLPGPRILTFLDAWYPGWTAFVDGVEVPVLKANEVFKAVELDAGTHEVRFAFQPRTTALGAAISGATALATLIAILLCVFRAWHGGNAIADRVAPLATEPGGDIGVDAGVPETSELAVTIDGNESALDLRGPGAVHAFDIADEPAPDLDGAECPEPLSPGRPEGGGRPPSA